MSELKIYKQSDVLRGHWFTEYCRKDEADKVIAHNKYKRCLAMAMWCSEKWADIATPYVKSVWYRKWQLRWLELAEVFK